VFSLPFELDVASSEYGDGSKKSLDKSSIYKELPEPLQQECQENIHLLVYLEALQKAGIGIPEYYEKLNRGMKSIKDPNLIYPVGNNIFIHILCNLEDIRDHYIPVEPCLTEDLEGLLDKVEEGLAEYVEELADQKDEAERMKVILQIVDRIVTVRGGNGSKPAPDSGKGKASGNGNGKDGKLGPLLGKKKTKGQLVVNPMQYRSLRYLLKCKLEGMGVLEPMACDSYIEDISCSGLGNIFVEHKIFGGLKSAIGFGEHSELDKFVIQLAERIKHPVTFREPTVDATLPDGSRINIVYGIDVSKRGSNFTIRKFSGVPMSIMELIDTGMLTYEMAAYLSVVIHEQMNIWVSGETASGKTTLMNALATFIPPNAKIVSIEDTPEVQVPHHNWIRGVTRESAKSSEASTVSMFDLLKAALRQRPNIIIIGEIRGAEGAIAFQAMQTGHACMSTFHAATVTKLIQRVTGNPINVPKSYVDNLNVVVTCQAVRLPDGKIGRRMTSVNEIISYDSVSDTFSFIESFVWNPVDDSFLFRGYMNSYLLEYKIAPKRGLPVNRRREIYALVKQRAAVLQRIKEQGITNFYDVYAILAKAYRDGQFR